MAHRDKVAGMVARAPGEGGRIVTGGSAPDLPGSYYRPTLIADVDEQLARSTATRSSGRC